MRARCFVLILFFRYLEKINLITDVIPLNIQFCRTYQKIHFLWRGKEDISLYRGQTVSWNSVILSPWIIERDSRANPYARRISSFLLWSDVESDFVPIRSQLITISRKFHRRVAAFWLFRTGRRTVSIIGIRSRSSSTLEIRNAEESAHDRTLRLVCRSKLVFALHFSRYSLYNVLKVGPNKRSKLRRIIWKIIVAHNRLYYILRRTE